MIGYKKALKNDSFYLIKAIVLVCKSYHFTVWKLSNDDVKAITLPLKSYFFILKVPFFSRKSPFSLLVWIFSWTFFQPPNDKNVLFWNIFLFPLFKHSHPSVDGRGWSILSFRVLGEPASLYTFLLLKELEDAPEAWAAYHSKYRTDNLIGYKEWGDDEAYSAE